MKLSLAARAMRARTRTTPPGTRSACDDASMVSMLRPTRAAPLAVAAAVALAACGGGGGDAPAATPTAPAVPTAPGGATTPSALMDLSGWKLNLPVDAFGGTGGSAGLQHAARTVLPQELVAGYASEWFNADAQGRLVFTAPANGAVTSPGVGSDHTRSELREFHRGGDAGGNWTGSGTLSARCEVRQVATASPRAVIGQLLGEQHVFAQVVYRPASADVAVDVYDSNAPGSRHELVVLARGVAPGQPIAYSLSLAGGVLVASVDGTSRSFAVAANWAGVPLFFKVGAYHLAPHTGNAAGDRTVVACERIAVRH